MPAPSFGCTPIRPELDKLLREAKERMQKMSLNARASMFAAQAISWSILGELVLSVHESEPHMRLEKAKSVANFLQEFVDVLEGRKTSFVSPMPDLEIRIAALLPKDRQRVIASAKTAIEGLSSD